MNKNRVDCWGGCRSLHASPREPYRDSRPGGKVYDEVLDHDAYTRDVASDTVGKPKLPVLRVSGKQMPHRPRGQLRTRPRRPFGFSLR